MFLKETDITALSSVVGTTLYTGSVVNTNAFQTSFLEGVSGDLRYFLQMSFFKLFSSFTNSNRRSMHQQIYQAQILTGPKLHVHLNVYIGWDKAASPIDVTCQSLTNMSWIRMAVALQKFIFCFEFTPVHTCSCNLYRWPHNCNSCGHINFKPLTLKHFWWHQSLLTRVMSCAVANDLGPCYMFIITQKSFSTYSKFESSGCFCDFYIYYIKFEEVTDFVGDSTLNQKFSISLSVYFGSVYLKMRYAFKKLPIFHNA